jgi:hypothetical protein
VSDSSDIKQVPNTFASTTVLPERAHCGLETLDLLRILLNGVAPATYRFRVDRKGRINSPYLRPFMVSRLTFNGAREAIEQRNVGRCLRRNELPVSNVLVGPSCGE